MKTLEKAKNLINIVGVGDIHGKFGEFGFRMKERYKITDSVIFLAGDIGMGFHQYNYYIDEFNNLNRIAKKLNNVIIGVRGNHDDPAYFDGSFEMSNIKLVPDYTVIETEANNVLLIGGGVSIDRKYRILDKTYWANELPYFDEEKLKSLGKVDVLISHTAPSFAYPVGKGDIVLEYAQSDPSLIEDSSYERMVFTKVFDCLKSNNNLPKNFCYGHFHMSKTEYFDDVKFRAMDELEFYQIN